MMAQYFYAVLIFVLIGSVVIGTLIWDGIFSLLNVEVSFYTYLFVIVRRVVSSIFARARYGRIFQDPNITF